MRQILNPDALLIPVLRPTNHVLRSAPMPERTKRVVLHTLDNLPSDHDSDCPRLHFWRGAKCVQFIVDCKPLSRVICGHDCLKSPELAPVFERMTTALFHVMGSGWSPHTLCADPVLWHQRECNCLADFLVNYTMDIQQSWEKCFVPTDDGFVLTDANIVSHSDGGTRAGQCSGAAWVVEAITSNKTFTLLMGGIFLQKPVSSFLVESLALESAIMAVKELVK